FIVFGAFIAIAKIITDTMTRHRLINKGMVDEKVKHLFAKNALHQRLSSLKWGMVLVGIGLALLLRQITDEYITDESVFGLMFIFAGVAFLIYYGISQRHLNGSREQ
ncbi:MAG: DUF6249 domain-containing protein, partial [Candidatus Binatia bacterium]